MGRPAGGKNVTLEEKKLKAEIFLETTRLKEKYEAEKLKLNDKKKKLNELVKERRKNIAKS